MVSFASNMVRTAGGLTCPGEVLGSEPRLNEFKRCLSFKVEFEGRDKRVRPH
jgi:hypothetical protein